MIDLEQIFKVAEFDNYTISDIKTAIEIIKSCDDVDELSESLLSNTGPDGISLSNEVEHGYGSFVACDRKYKIEKIIKVTYQ